MTFLETHPLLSRLISLWEKIKSHCTRNENSTKTARSASHIKKSYSILPYVANIIEDSYEILNNANNESTKGSPNFLGFGAKFTIHYPCRGQMLTIQSPILQSAVQIGDCNGKNEIGRRQKLKNVKQTSALC